MLYTIVLIFLKNLWWNMLELFKRRFNVTCQQSQCLMKASWIQKSLHELQKAMLIIWFFSWYTLAKLISLFFLYGTAAALNKCLNRRIIHKTVLQCNVVSKEFMRGQIYLKMTKYLNITHSNSFFPKISWDKGQTSS